MNNDQLIALEWVKTGSETGWGKSHRNAMGRLSCPGDYFSLWDLKMVHHDEFGNLCLTDAGEAVILEEFKH